jgi:hypothetical protein
MRDLRLLVLGIVVALWSPVVGQDDGEKKGPDKKGPEKEPEKEKKDAKDAKKKPSYDLIAWGQLKPIKKQEGFYEFSYIGRVKRRPKKLSAFVKIGDDLKVLKDRRATPKQLVAGTKAFVLGKVFEKNSLSATGLANTEFSMRNVQALLIGKGIKVNVEYRDRRDEEVMWYSAVIVDAKKGVVLTIDENEHRTTLGSRSLIIQRLVAEPKDLGTSKKGFYAFILAKKSEERPETKKKSDEKKGAFVTSRIILLDPTAVKAGLYSKIYE